MTKICKDTAIKLFGRTIPLHEAHINPAPSVEESVKVPLKETPRTQSIQENQENQENQAHSKPDPNPNPNPQDSPTKPESNNGSESGSDKTLKKPDKIIPCPRCNSMDTKFCYYNNYNVNQPRHFCKNCQRYWTAGGTMRNVPVGAGRRKNNNKHINVNQFRQVMLTSSSPERFLGQQQAVPVCNSGTGTVLKFGTDVPLCESMQNNLSIKEEKNNINNNNSDMNNNNSNTDEQQSSCNSNSNEPGLLLNSNNNMGPTMQCYNPHGFMWGPAIPMPFIPASFWPGPWWTGFTNVIPSSPNSSSSSGSPTLGKHARDTDLCDLNVKSEKRNNSNNGNLWAPKTVRLVDPEEAAKSSILATLGIKKDDRGIFGNLTGKEISGKCDAGPVLNANPAALSRFQSFQERT